MRLSRLVLALVVALRAVLIYGEAEGAGSAALSWRDLLPARLRMPRSAAAQVAAARRYA
jgi:hypothetical protein